jgi:hypothetical protein
LLLLAGKRERRVYENRFAGQDRGSLNKTGVVGWRIAPAPPSEDVSYATMHYKFNPVLLQLANGDGLRYSIQHTPTHY